WHIVPRPTPPSSVTYTRPPGIRRPQTPDAARWCDRIDGVPLPVRTTRKEGGEVRYRVDVPEGEFELAGMRVRTRAGGLHSLDPPQFHQETDEYALLSIDVQSCYPYLVATRGIWPAQYDGAGLDLFRGMLRDRVEIKGRIAGTTDPAELARLRS